MNEVSKKIFDKDFRQRLIDNPKQTLKELGYSDIDDNVDYKVVKNTKDLFYVVLGQSNPIEVDLDNIQAAGIASSAGTGGTIGTATLTVGSASSIGTIGSAF